MEQIHRSECVEWKKQMSIESNVILLYIHFTVSIFIRIYCMELFELCDIDNVYILQTESLY